LETWLDNALHQISTKYDFTNVSQNQVTLPENDLTKLRGEILAMFAAGTDTTGYAFEYSIVTLAKYQKCQELIYNELIGVYHNKESFNLSKINDCPIFRAFISESLRCAIPVPQGGPRTPDCDALIEITSDNISEEYKNEIGKKFVLKKKIFHSILSHTFCQSGTSVI